MFRSSAVGESLHHRPPFHGARHARCSAREIIGSTFGRGLLRQLSIPAQSGRLFKREIETPVAPRSSGCSHNCLRLRRLPAQQERP